MFPFDIIKIKYVKKGENMIELLKNLSYFKELNTDLLENLILDQKIIKKSYSKGKTVHEQGEECAGIDIIVSGRLIAYSLTTSGSETIVFEFFKGDAIGANLLFGNQNKYPLNIYCVEDTVVIHVLKSAVEKLLKESSFVMEFIKTLSLNSQGLNRKIAMYTQKSLRENLMDYFLALAATQKTKTIYLPISKKQLADHLGVQRPSLFRELKNMKEEGLIEVDNRYIELLF